MVANKNQSLHRNKRYALILAAGQSIRFKSLKPKVLHPLCGKSLICHVLDKLKGLNIERTFVVIGPDGDEVKSALGGYPVNFVSQSEQLGTGHAVMAAAPQLRDLRGSLLVLYADTPLIRTQTLRRLLKTREKHKADQVLLTTDYENPSGYGRIIRNEKGEAMDIVEEKDASAEQKAIREVNAGLNCFRIPSLLEALSQLSPANAAQEYYLTDILRILRNGGKKVVTISTDLPNEARGVNNREELSLVEINLRAQIARRWMLEGVTILNPSSVYIDESVELSPDAIIYPGVLLEGKTKVGAGCVIHSFCHLKDTVLDQEVMVDQCSVIRNSSIGKNTRVGPFAHLRDNTVIGPEARIGSFVEVKKSRIGKRTTAAHLSYLGDAEIGSQVNVGAGTITCNYDGIRKHKTVIEDQVFIGSDSQLVAPVTLHQGSYVAAGSSITEDVPEYALGIARARQINKEGWTRRRAGEQKKKEKRKKKEQQES
ncbi:bifunctional UDP-N-acetylglucosamine diphosphorylase/glucosamine-1-phosphate N-acetyltransferase GlmU [Acidobacteria bacterium AH-259-G07]|nr:bifunctional UDP-N-acetylglucosamine diphosphorylase/glucosamine-1-phosphate N-acetyltransferase GlmU [Acidobacteria bacterium AH-259-G07]